MTDVTPRTDIPLCAHARAGESGLSQTPVTSVTGRGALSFSQSPQITASFCASPAGSPLGLAQRSRLMLTPYEGGNESSVERRGY